MRPLSCFGVRVPRWRLSRFRFLVCHRARNFQPLAQFVVPKFSSFGRGKNAGRIKPLILLHISPPAPLALIVAVLPPALSVMAAGFSNVNVWLPTSMPTLPEVLLNVRLKMS